ncbi:hypothetical protein [Allorhodopirellula heiligendammensis]|uniref:Uncharacterized protein n=1 Tax=Allorhodopirellula heiligendammensis TaxID=2714739 RepID=A0A5C6BVN2_9BACT|nr:hypothetical protein [Allorhodopirellula heiligendammensis]TWU16333.1 hypothetical protein Poly21_35380 [Allorhodopirellula heiligendammensis]
MHDREPALLVVFIGTDAFRWHVAAIGPEATVIPLLRSDDGNLDPYRDLEPDAQLSFLRHRIAGVLQRGCDRLYPRGMKVSHFLLIADGHYPDAAEDITTHLAEHFVEWMINPPVTYLLHDGASAQDSGRDPLADLTTIAGEFPAEVAAALQASWPDLISLLQEPDSWELIARPPAQDG